MAELLDLPDLSDAFPLDPAAVAAFAAKGHTCIRGLASRDEVAAFTPAITKAAEDNTMERRPLEERGTYGKAFLQMFNLHRVDPVVEAFVFARRFARVAAELLGVEGVRLYHDQALFKEPGGGFTPWHQDQTYWPLETDRTITMWMPLADVPPEIGTMTFVNGTHRAGHLGASGISDETQAGFDEMLAAGEWETETHGPLAAGDATFHAGWTLHAAPPNPTERLRPVMTVIWFADDTVVAPVTSPMQELDLAIWLAPRQPGETADGPGNPLLYRREETP
jgi:ectoine hydroxylase-related dioxygenase (phytanoyl-CoA dioxygenase family)